jgi:hypothetical protein
MRRENRGRLARPRWRENGSLLAAVLMLLVSLAFRNAGHGNRMPVVTESVSSAPLLMDPVDRETAYGFERRHRSMYLGASSGVGPAYDDESGRATLCETFARHPFDDLSRFARYCYRIADGHPLSTSYYFLPRGSRMDSGSEIQAPRQAGGIPTLAADGVLTAKHNRLVEAVRRTLHLECPGITNRIIDHLNDVWSACEGRYTVVRRGEYVRFHVDHNAAGQAAREQPMLQESEGFLR